MTFSALQNLAQLFTERELNAAVAGMLLAGLVWMLLRLTGRQNSGTRFAIWFSALMAIVAFPFLSFIHSSHLPVVSTMNSHKEIVLAASWASYLFAAWGIGASLLLLRIVVGLWRVCAIRRNCIELDLAVLDPAIAGVLKNAASRRNVRLCVSSELAVPAALGLFRPAIVFPAQLLLELSAQEIELIVRHELAHLCRWDDWTNLAQKVVKAVFFFHPAVWWIENRLTLEREMACDDMVLAQTGSPKAYASSLIEFAEKLHSARSLALAQALVSRMHQMSLRVEQILDVKRPRGTRIWKPAIGLSAGLLAIVIGAAPYMPRLVAFENPAGSEVRDAQINLEPATDESATHASEAMPAKFAVQTATLPRAIAAAFHPRSTLVRSASGPSLKARQVKARVESLTKTKQVPSPMVMRAAAVEEETAAPKIYVLRTVEYEASSPTGRSVWTLCVWKVDVNNPADRQLESTIVVSWI
jgi:beta-lactamase regulating signal transducer with metallopeptidase domain